MAKQEMSGFQISRKGMIIWIGLIVFIAGWMFVLGIMVGRGMAPVNLEAGKLEKELAELKAKMLEKEQAKAQAQAAGEKGQAPPLGFYEALKSPSKEKSAFKSLPPAPPKPSPATVKPKPAPKPRPAPRAAVQPKPETKAAATPQPVAKTPPERQKGHFTIQIAAVQDAGAAEKLVAELRKKGYRAYQIRSKVAGKGVWHRVRVGAFEARSDADKLLAKLKRDHYGGMVVSTR